MDKRRKNVVVIISSAVIIGASLTFYFSLFNHASPSAINDDFEINFTSSFNQINDSDSTIQGTKDVKSEKGNTFIIDYENVVSLDSYWQKVNINGYFYFGYKEVEGFNKIHGLKNIVFNFDEPSLNFKIYFSFDGNFDDNWSKSYVTTAGEQTISLSEGHPNYFKFVAIDNVIKIKDFTLSFSCDTSSDESWQKNHGVIPTISEDQNTLTYGLYPQTHVKNPEQGLIDAAEGKADKEYFWYKDDYYVTGTGNPDDEGTPTFSTNTQIVKGAKYYFKCEVVKWNIVERNTHYVADCYNILDCEAFDTGPNYNNNYENSDIRSWLNNDFYKKAFFLNNSKIVPTDLSDVYLNKEKIWIGSESEYINWYDKSSRSKIPCDFALCNKARQSSATLTKGKSWYWTRTPGTNYKYEYKVNLDGEINSLPVENDNTGASPCFTFSIS